uniref:Small integral membrane protein 2 n=1 Tax=Macaca fascicularis TaxID=9541 RepID=G7PW47_MACFA
MEAGKRTDASQLPHGVLETRGHAISILLGFWMSFICDTYIVLAWISKIKGSPGVSASSDEPHTRIQQSRRQCHAEEDQSQVPEAASPGHATYTVGRQKADLEHLQVDATVSMTRL